MQLPQRAIVWEVELTCLLDTIAAPTWTEEVRLPADRPDQSDAVAHRHPSPGSRGGAEGARCSRRLHRCMAPARDVA